MTIYAEKCSCHILGHIRALVPAFFGPAEDFPYWKYVVLAGVKQRTHQAELVGKNLTIGKSFLHDLLRGLQIHEKKNLRHFSYCCLPVTIGKPFLHDFLRGLDNHETKT